MIERALEFIKEHGTLIKDSSDYLKDPNYDWTLMVDRKDRIREHNLHLDILKSFVDKIKYVKLEAGEEFLTNSTVLKFAKNLVNKLNDYTKRCNNYFKIEKWANYDDTENKSDEIKFQNEILNHLIKVKEQIKDIDLDNQNDKDVKIGTFGDVIFSIPQRDYLEERHSDIKFFLESRRKNA